MSEISVIQTITNGEKGYPKDSIVQIGIVSVDMSTSETVGEHLITVKSDTDKWTESQREYLSGRVSEKEIENGLPIDDAVKSLKDIVRGKDVTSYEVSNSFSRYLVFEPWDITHDADILPSISVRVPANLRGRLTFNENTYIERAYTSFVNGIVPDRPSALDYARMSASVMIFLRKEGLY